MRARSLIPVLVGLLAATACAQPSGRAQGTAGAGQPPPSRTLIMALRHNMPDLHHKIPGPGAQDVLKRIFNAALTLNDHVGATRPYLAESLPEVGTDRWRVFPDGRMETTYTLKPNLTWHDGRPLTAEDFAFAWSVYLHPTLSTFGTEPESRMESVAPTDARTLVIRWKTLFPDAGRLGAGDLDPLPRHLLDEVFSAVREDPGAADSFINHRFWNVEYVGAGPFRLERWAPGSEWEGSAFEGHALGRPKIDRLIVRLIPDTNTVLSNVLAGAVQYAPDHTLLFEHAQVLLREWVPANKGTVVMRRGAPLHMDVQLRPDYVGNPAMLDVRVRKAVAHSIDRQAINDGVFEGTGFPTEHPVPQEAPYFADVDRAVVKHPYDPRRTEQLMAEVGFTKDSEGIFVDRTGRRFSIELRYSAGAEWERRVAIIADAFRRSGIIGQPFSLPEEAGRDRETRATFPGLASRGGGLNERTMTSTEIASPANRWGGANRTGWGSSDYDSFYQRFETTLDQSQRIQHVVQMLRVLTDELPIYVLHFGLMPNAYAADLQGAERGVPSVGTLSGGTTQHWNIHEWSWK